LIFVNAGIVSTDEYCSVHSREQIMPIDTIIVVSGILAAFVGFAAVLAWASTKTVTHVK
jgi:hypothetical protein